MREWIKEVLAGKRRRTWQNWRKDMTNEEAIKRLDTLRRENLFLQMQDVAALDLAIAALERDRWISVEEKLPVGGDKSGAVCEDIWMLFDNGDVFCGWMNGCTEKSYYLDGYNDFVRKRPIDRVIAWRPKPEPPKEEHNGE